MDTQRSSSVGEHADPRGTQAVTYGTLQAVHDPYSLCIKYASVETAHVTDLEFLHGTFV